MKVRRTGKNDIFAQVGANFLLNCLWKVLILKEFDWPFHSGINELTNDFTLFARQHFLSRRGISTELNNRAQIY